MAEGGTTNGAFRLLHLFFDLLKVLNRSPLVRCEYANAGPAGSRNIFSRSMDGPQVKSGTTTAVNK